MASLIAKGSPLAVRTTGLAPRPGARPIPELDERLFAGLEAGDFGEFEDRTSHLVEPSVAADARDIGRRKGTIFQSAQQRVGGKAGVLFEGIDQGQHKLQRPLRSADGPLSEANIDDVAVLAERGDERMVDTGGGPRRRWAGSRCPARPCPARHRASRANDDPSAPSAPCATPLGWLRRMPAGTSGTRSAARRGRRASGPHGRRAEAD